MTEPGGNQLRRRLLLEALVPMGWFNLGALVVVPLLFRLLAGRYLDHGQTWWWAGGVWAGAALHAIGIAGHSRWWAASARAIVRWEWIYAGISGLNGLIWASFVLIERTSQDRFGADMLLLVFMVMASASAVTSFAGSLLAGRFYLAGQWVLYTTVMLARSSFGSAGLGLAVMVAAVSYQTVIHLILARTVDARVHSSALAGELAVQASTDSLTGLLNRGAVVDAADALLDRHGGYELLARWVRPDGTVIPPDEFIPLAEHYGHDRALGRAMLTQAAEAALASGLRFGVNVTPNHLLSGHLYHDLCEVLERTGAPADQMIVEITESQVMTDITRAAAEAGRIEALGAAMAIDDFGVGASSLALADQLPCTYLKTAPELALRLSTSRRARPVLECVAGLGHQLGYRVVAEGIETAEVAALVAAVGIRYGQGFHFARPRPLAEVLALPRHRYAPAGAETPVGSQSTTPVGSQSTTPVGSQSTTPVGSVSTAASLPGLK